MSKLQTRNGVASDLDRLVEIYNHFVINTHVTFDTEPYAIAARTHWFAQFSDSGAYRLLVAEKEGAAVAYATSTNFKPRAGYNTSVETSVYLHPDETGQGIGRSLYKALLDILVAEPGVHRAYGGVALPNPASVALHEGLGFENVGTYREVGFKFDKYWDVSWYEKDLE